jgi:hypothetical protein
MFIVKLFFEMKQMFDISGEEMEEVEEILPRVD